jgi:hypothetical protein
MPMPRLMVLLFACLLEASGAQYYVDSQAGDDANPGTSRRKPWRSLDKVNAVRFQPGDKMLFRAGSRWTGQLRITAQGAPGLPVTFQAYGRGPRPRLDALGQFEDTLLLSNAQHVVLSYFELTNRRTNDSETNRPVRRAVHILGDNAGTLTNIVVSGLYIHDVHGTQKRKDNGGIIFTTRGERIPTRFDGLRIERNILWQVDRSGIVAQSYHARRTRWFPSSRVVIRDNWLGDIGGDGITPWATDGCLVEHNVLQGANERAGTYNAGIWPWSTDNTVLRLNCVSGVKTLMDGQGFDSDYNCHNTVIEYNLSYDNQGGFLLICTPGNLNQKENCGNVATIVRYNISRNDGARIFHVSAAEQTLIYSNAIYTAPNAEVQVLLLSDWNGWAKGLEFRHNLFDSEGVSRYGHQVSRNPNGSYGIGPGWGPATGIVFQGNRYLGRHEHQPVESNPTDSSAPIPIRFSDWPGPQFDPRNPEKFPAYIQHHRTWMMRLMRQQFGRRPASEQVGSSKLEIAPIGALPGGQTSVAIQSIDPPESGFFAKRLDYEGIPIKAPTNVVDEALFAACERLSMMLTNLPGVRANLRVAGAELHIIGRGQVTTDLPEWRQDKGKPLTEYHGLTRDQRTRGMGGLLTSCGEENLLKLEQDRYRGRDICVHEFAHNILSYGVSESVREKVRQQYRRSLENGHWVGSYAGSNDDEFFAELSMWYFGTHGDLGMKGAKPSTGREGLKNYDPEAFTLLEDFYSGRLESTRSRPQPTGSP